MTETVIVTDAHAADTIHVLRHQLTQARREADELGECLKAAMAAIHRMADAAGVPVGGVLTVTVDQIVEMLERAKATDRERARILEGLF